MQASALTIERGYASLQIVNREWTVEWKALCYDCTGRSWRERWSRAARCWHAWISRCPRCARPTRWKWQAWLTGNQFRILLTAILSCH